MPACWFVTHWYLFAIGVLSFIHSKNPAELPFPYKTCAIVLLCYSVWFGHYALLVGLATAYSISVPFEFRGKTQRTVGRLSQLGIVTYSVYLIHGLASIPLSKILTIIPEGDLSYLSVVFVYTVLVVFAAIFFYRLVEVPAIRLSRKIVP